jgi:hypothetical protein
VLAAVLSVPLSQLGHLVAYLLRYGPSAWSQQTVGVHAYFPSVAKTSATALGVVALGALAVVGVARLVEGVRSPGGRRPSRAPLLTLLAVLLPLQLAIFTTQETTEAVLAGHLHGFGDVPLLWGLAGQAPVACLAALFLAWASIAIDEAIHGFRVWLDRVVAPPPLPVLVAGTTSSGRNLGTPFDSSTTCPKRGPPRPAHRPLLDS